MFHKRDRIIKKDGEKPSELEEEVAKGLHALSTKFPDHHSNLKIIFLNSVKQVEYNQRDGSRANYLLVRIPHRSLGAFRKVGSVVQEELEAKFGKQVIIVANRNIQSPTAKRHATQMRPRSRNLVTVHKEILTDVLYPSNIQERSTRVQADGRRQEIVLLDPLDNEIMEDKLDAIIDCYHKLTTHKISLGFAKPSVFQQKVIKFRNEKAAKN
jgi:small subunit ribosomal protein S7e